MDELFIDGSLEAIRSLRSVNDIASEYGVYPTQVGQLNELFVDGF